MAEGKKLSLSIDDAHKVALGYRFVHRGQGAGKYPGVKAQQATFLSFAQLQGLHIVCGVRFSLMIW